MAFRYHHAMNHRPLFTSAGFPTSSLFGVMRALVSIVEKESPEYMVVASDSSEPTFRHEIYSEYKAGRTEMPAELSAQIPKLYELMEILGLPVIRKSGMEADDIIATLAIEAQQQGYEVFMVTGDKDMMQLVAEDVRLYQTLPQKNQVRIIGPEEVRDYFGVSPEQVICAQSLIGDSSDNVPGVMGIGKVGAAKLLKTYESLDGIYENIDNITPAGLQKKLIEGKDRAFLSRKLVTLKTDLDLGLDLKNTALSDHLWKETNEELDRFLCQCEFRSLHKKYFPHSSLITSTSPFAPEGTEPPPPPAPTLQEKSLPSSPSVEERFQELSSADVNSLEPLFQSKSCASVVSFTLIMEGQNPLLIKPLGIAVSVVLQDSESMRKERHNYFVRWSSHLGENFKERLKDFFSDTTKPMITYDLKRQLHGLSQLLSSDLTSCSHIEDVMIQGSLVHALGGHPSFSFLCAEHHSDPDLVPQIKGCEKQVYHNKTKSEDLLTAPLLDYFLQLAELLDSLHESLSTELKAAEMMAVYHTIEKPLIPILASMERSGVFVSPDALKDFSQKLAQKEVSLEKSIHDLAGEVFNIQSPKQMSAILYDKHGLHHKYKLKSLRKTASGFSTRESVLLKMSEEPLVVSILEYRKIMKLKGTYADALPQLINSKTGRIHTSYLQNGTATGRMSSRDPNLQNIPIRSTMGKEIRRAFMVQKPHHVLVSADYSQIELRVLAHMSGDEKLQQAFRQHDDVHKTTAAVMLGKEIESVTPEDREMAKAINYGMIYGMGPKKLAKIINVSFNKAQQLMDQYFATFSRVSPFMEAHVKWAHDYGHTRTLYGRRRTLVEVHDPAASVRAGAENAAKNSPIQGSAADLMKLAMIEVYHLLKQKNLQNTLLMQVHDELVFEVPEASLEDALKAIRQGMEEVVSWQVPVVVSIGTGKNWLEAH